jgi:polyhydroxyalkanoate synthase
MDAAAHLNKCPMNEEFSFQKLVAGLTKMNQEIIENYLDNFSSYNYDVRDIFMTYSSFYTKILVDTGERIRVAGDCLGFISDQQKIWTNVFIPVGEKAEEPFISPKEGDNRFEAREWSGIPFFNFIKQSYLLYEKYVDKIVAGAEMDEEKRKKIRFYSKQYSSLLSPSNFLFTNPEAIDLAVKSRGESLWKGFLSLLEDLENKKISQTDNTAFRVGGNLAITPGAVVFENDLVQLIQYKSSTKQISEIPLLLIPPWINKYYILDLRPENSFIKYLVDKGFMVFVISWRVPSPEMGYLTFDNYAESAIRAVEVAKDISQAQKVNVLGYCLGGTLLGVIASVLAARGREIINTVTFLAAMIDFRDIGPMGDVINDALISKLRRGELTKDGVLHGYDMERAFNLIRVNDLVWKYVVNNYLKGMRPSPFDVLFWTNDNTNLPKKMFLYYMEHMILENNLSRKNELVICDTPIDIGKITVPAFIISFNGDYISPPATVFITSRLVSGPVEIILGESGHVMGVVNPPSKKKYGHYIGGETGKGFHHWRDTSHFVPGSWWLTWSKKLRMHSGDKIEAPENPGNNNYPIIESAPGKYVTEKYHGYFKKMSGWQTEYNELKRTDKMPVVRPLL